MVPAAPLPFAGTCLPPRAGTQPTTRWRWRCGPS